MDIKIVDAKEAEKTSPEEIFQILGSKKEGLNESEAKARLVSCGKNVLEEVRTSKVKKFFGHFWGPIPWMIEAAAILSLIARHLDDFFIIFALLLVNGLVDFWQDFRAGNAIDALKKQLAPKALVKREGRWQEIDAANLVPGDIIRVRGGAIIPADAKLLEGEYLSVDQSSLTGESLPVSKKLGAVIYSGSIVKQGEMVCIVTATASDTFFGKTFKLVNRANPVSHFQKAVLHIGDYLIYISLALALLLVIVQIFRGDDFLQLVQFVLILVVASIPVAMPAVLSITMALGALKLSKMKAIVTKLESIEEIAGIDILCSDKTGTLTQNKLSLDAPLLFSDAGPDEVILQAALASKEENKDPIDLAILGALKNPESLKSYRQKEFSPFDPVKKRTQASVIDGSGKTFYTTKGAMQVILDLCSVKPEKKNQITKVSGELAAKGMRTLAVATSDDGKNWQFLALLPLFDPLRDDSKNTVSQAKEHGIQIKMLTGDSIAIAKEVAGQLEIGENILVASDVFGKKNSEEGLIENSNGFAQVFPEHKYKIVKALQEKKHIVGMTGDGVNDAPALKQADVGIAVNGATDAARSAASLVLLAPGLSVIIQAIEEARRIFERMNSYCIYRIAETICIMLFMVTSILVFNFYPVTAVMIILLALLNDIPILTIAYDKTLLEKKPVHWNLKRVLTISTLLGAINIIETFIILYVAKDIFKLTVGEIQSFIFLTLSVAGHQTLFVARTKEAFFKKPFPSKILTIAILSTQALAAIFVGFGIFVTAISWKYIGLIWLYTLIWMFVLDGVKILFYRHLDFTGQHHKNFLQKLKHPIHFH